jgi:hypothetical protein
VSTHQRQVRLLTDFGDSIKARHVVTVLERFLTARQVGADAIVTLDLHKPVARESPLLPNGSPYRRALFVRYIKALEDNPVCGVFPVGDEERAGLFRKALKEALGCPIN